MIDSFEKLKAYIKADLTRYLDGQPVTSKRFFRSYCFTPGFNYTFWLRVCQWAAGGNHKLIFAVARLRLHNKSIKYGISIPWQTQVGPGLYIGHFGGIVVNPNAVIGCNVNLTDGVTIGQRWMGSAWGYPVIGDRVYIGTSAKVLGGCKLGDDSAVGACALILSDIPNKGVAVGIPAKVVSYKGSSMYVGSLAGALF